MNRNKWASRLPRKTSNNQELPNANPSKKTIWIVKPLDMAGDDFTHQHQESVYIDAIMGFGFSYAMLCLCDSVKTIYHKNQMHRV